MYTSVFQRIITERRQLCKHLEPAGGVEDV